MLTVGVSCRFMISILHLLSDWWFNRMPKWMRPLVRRNDASVSSGSGPVRFPVLWSMQTISHRVQGPAGSGQCLSTNASLLRA